MAGIGGQGPGGARDLVLDLVGVRHETVDRHHREQRGQQRQEPVERHAGGEQGDAVVLRLASAPRDVSPAAVRPPLGRSVPRSRVPSSTVTATGLPSGGNLEPDRGPSAMGRAGVPLPSRESWPPLMKLLPSSDPSTTSASPSGPVRRPGSSSRWASATTGRSCASPGPCWRSAPMCSRTRTSTTSRASSARSSGRCAIGREHQFVPADFRRFEPLLEAQRAAGHDDGRGAARRRRLVQPLAARRRDVDGAAPRGRRPRAAARSSRSPRASRARSGSPATATRCTSTRSTCSSSPTRTPLPLPEGAAGRGRRGDRRARRVLRARRAPRSRPASGRSPRRSPRCSPRATAATTAVHSEMFTTASCGCTRRARSRTARAVYDGCRWRRSPTGPTQLYEWLARERRGRVPARSRS